MILGITINVQETGAYILKFIFCHRHLPKRQVFEDFLASMNIYLFEYIISLMLNDAI